MSFTTKSLVVLFCTALLPEVAHAQLTTVASCDAVSVQDNFDADAYLGRWYENARAEAENDQANGKCATADYSNAVNGSFSVTNTLTDSATNERQSITGSAFLASTNGDAKFFVTIDSGVGAAPYWVLGTDYVNYSVVWSCSDVTGENGSVTAWILTRSSEPTAEVIEAAYAVLDANNIPRDFVTVTDQKDCTY